MCSCKSVKTHHNLFKNIRKKKGPAGLFKGKGGGRKGGGKEGEGGVWTPLLKKPASNTDSGSFSVGLLLCLCILYCAKYSHFVKYFGMLGWDFFDVGTFATGMASINTFNLDSTY